MAARNLSNPRPGPPSGLPAGGPAGRGGPGFRRDFARSLSRADSRPTQADAGGKGGFSLVELIVVLAILTVLATLALPLAELTEVRAREKRLWQNLAEMRFAIDRYRRSHVSSYPSCIASLLQPIPSNQGILKPGFPAGPFLATDSVVNPFVTGGDTHLLAADAFYWDIRDTNGGWHSETRNLAFSPGTGVADVGFPSAGVAGWKTALDGSSYDRW